ncbi:MAG: DUF2127 domain-containing protein [Deltaproteobacteria bacterium]|nr:DUF2127 domain-containing protein [Deltaproteobacteria bacterium]
MADAPATTLDPATGLELMTPALRAIIVYKAAKSALQLLAGLGMILALLIGVERQLHALEVALRQHFTEGWSARLALVLAHYANVKTLRIGVLAITVDGVLSGVEAWALHHRRWWGPWLVVVASGSLIPVELYEVVRHPHVGRVLLLALNGVVVTYLARRALREHRERVNRATRPGSPAPASTAPRE